MSQHSLTLNKHIQYAGSRLLSLSHPHRGVSASVTGYIVPQLIIIICVDNVGDDHTLKIVLVWVGWHSIHYFRCVISGSRVTVLIMGVPGLTLTSLSFPRPNNPHLQHFIFLELSCLTAQSVCPAGQVLATRVSCEGCCS